MYKMTRVAFFMINEKVWAGGHNYLLNLFRVLIKFRQVDVQPVLFVGADIHSDDLRSMKAIDGLQIIVSARLNRSRKFISLLRTIFFGVDSSVERLFEQHQIDVVFENAQFFGKKLSIPSIAWIPDFQHRELPHLFSFVAWWKRELGFRAQISGSRAIMLSSNDARDACERYYPNTIGRTHIVRFGVLLVENPKISDINEVRKLYGLPDRYFYLPNQFWKHKNHLLVVDALDILSRAGHSLIVVASGKKSTSKKSEYYNDVIKKVSSLGLSEQFLSLDFVPYCRVAPLMLGSVALLNPSLYEGWSTSVEEAKSLGVTMLLSDLAVHKEQTNGAAIFFERHSAESLAENLLAVWQSEEHSSARCSESTRCSPSSTKMFADNFSGLVSRVRT